MPGTKQFQGLVGSLEQHNRAFEQNQDLDIKIQPSQNNFFEIL
jgi:hypothetical protein